MLFVLSGFFVAWQICRPVEAQHAESKTQSGQHPTDRKRLGEGDLLDMTAWKLQDPQQVVDKFAVRPHESTPLDLNVRKSVEPIWDLELTQLIRKEIKLGTKLLIEISSACDLETPCEINIERTKAPYDKIFSEGVLLQRAIEEGDPVIREVVVAKTMPPDEYSFRLELGKARGHVKFASISLVATGQDEEVLKVRKRIAPDQLAHRIDRFRKGDLVIAVVDHSGKSVPNAQVSIEQTSHKFLFGGTFNNFRINETSPTQLNYQKRFLQLFNYATVPFPWMQMEPQRGKIDFKAQEQMVAWCKTHQITPKGGPLLWDWICPNWLPTNPPVLAHILRSHIAETIDHFGADIKTWDVISEVADEWTPAPNAFGRWLKQDGPLVLTDKALEWSKLIDHDPNRVLLYVDWEEAKHRKVLNSLAKSDNLPDAIGLETTFYKDNLDLEDVWRLCEAYKRYEKPLHFTQVSILSGPTRPAPPFGKTATDWLSTTSGEAKQADYVEQFYSVLFSHPSVQSITWRDLGDKDAYMGAPGGLLRKDGTAKPAFERLRKLIHEHWWTKATLKTDQNGKCSTRAFWGSYIITVNRGNGPPTRTSLKFYDAGQPTRIVVN